MPVIREQKRFAIGPIGIARQASIVPGSNAAGTIAETVANSANEMADTFFRRGAQLAEKKGLEQGASVAPEMIIAIDPATGAPKAYPPPKGMGIIAQDAYQRVIQTRFQTSIEDELKFKAAELSTKYNGSVDRYSAAMSEYIGAMAQTAEGQFKGLIIDIGTSYLNATRTSMTLDQINRERAAAKKANDASIALGLDTLEDFVANSGLTDFE
jgi:hypothetical protein